MTNLQILSLLFFFPMCSIDLYVEDVIWYYRHHYSFIELLKVFIIIIIIFKFLLLFIIKKIFLFKNI